MQTPRSWARHEFGTADLGDERRRRRLLRMVEVLVARPGGTVAGVYKDAAERQAAYDFLSNTAISPEALVSATAAATARRCDGYGHVFVAIDGTSFTMKDRLKTKGLGSIGARRFPTRGLMAIDALALTPDGTPQGLLDVQLWARGARRKKSSRFVRRRRRDTEMRHWSNARQSVSDTLSAHTSGTRPWFVMDREADESALLSELVQADEMFTIRARQDRVTAHNARQTKLFATVAKSKARLVRRLELGRTPTRSARTARVEIRAASVTVQLPRYVERALRTPLALNVVEVRERSGRADRIRWVLLTNSPIATTQDVEAVVRSYVLRWRVEELHRTWKAGGCGAEDMQLRNAGAIRKWAILLGAVAARTERLKHLSRTNPDAPATLEFSEVEIEALIVAKRRIKTSVESVPDGIPTIKMATRWVGDLGGYAGHYKGYEPGAVTIGRGLETLAVWTEALIAYRTLQKPRRKPTKKR